MCLKIVGSFSAEILPNSRKTSMKGKADMSQGEYMLIKVTNLNPVGHLIETISVSFDPFCERAATLEQTYQPWKLELLIDSCVLHDLGDWIFTIKRVSTTIRLPAQAHNRDKTLLPLCINHQSLSFKSIHHIPDLTCMFSYLP